MKVYLKFMAAVVVLFGLMQLTGCAGYQRVPMAQTSRDQIMGTHVLVNGVQHHVMIHNNAMLDSHVTSGYNPMPEGAVVSYDNTDPATMYGVGNGGMIQGLTDQIVLAIGAHHDATNNKKQLAPILAAQGRDHFMHNFKQDLMAHFAHMHWLHANSGQVAYDLSKHRDAFMPGAANNVLFVGTTYALNSHMNQLEVTAYVESSLKADSKASPIYKNRFTYIYSIGDSSDIAANQAVWMANHAALLRTQLRKAAFVLSGLIARDIRNANVTAAPAGAMQVKLRGTHDDYDGKKQTVPVLAREHGRVTVLMPDGEIYNVNNRYLLH